MIQENSQITIADPQKELTTAIAHYTTLTQFVSKVLKENVDYGIIRGTKKPSLYKAGAEKICQLFKLRPEFTLVRHIEDWTGEAHGLKEPLFYYNYRCVLYYPKVGGTPVGEATGSCNSLENKYRGSNWRWELVNTIDKMSQKRAFVSACLVSTGASEYFTVDLDTWENINNDPSEKLDLIQQVGDRVKELGWSIDVAQAHLYERFGVKGRKQLSVPQLKALLDELNSEELCQ